MRCVQKKKLFGNAGGFQARPPVQQAAPMDAQSMAIAMQKAQDAAARIIGSSQSITRTPGPVSAGFPAVPGPPAQVPASVQPPWLQHTQPSGFPHAPSNAHTMHAAEQPPLAAPRMTPEEARRLAQEAAQRASLSAAQNKGEKWEWAKT
jgi:hypothetical protein